MSTDYGIENVKGKKLQVADHGELFIIKKFSFRLLFVAWLQKWKTVNKKKKKCSGGNYDLFSKSNTKEVSNENRQEKKPWKDMNIKCGE